MAKKTDTTAEPVVVEERVLSEIHALLDKGTTPLMVEKLIEGPVIGIEDLSFEVARGEFVKPEQLDASLLGVVMEAEADPEYMLLDAAAKDQASELAEQKVFFDALSKAEKNRLLVEQFDWTVQELDVSTSESLRPRFVTRAIETEAKIAEFDSPLAKWQARGKEREAQMRDAIRMNRETLAALKYAQTATTPAPAPATTSTGGN